MDESSKRLIHDEQDRPSSSKNNASSAQKLLTDVQSVKMQLNFDASAQAQEPVLVDNNSSKIKDLQAPQSAMTMNEASTVVHPDV